MTNHENQRFYTLQFDGASRGNPGPAGAGAVLFDQNGNVLYHFRKGLGYQTNNAAEYHALILGLEQALMKGCRNIKVQGDSQLVINQFRGSYRINNPRLRNLCDKVLELWENFRSFDIKHISREFNFRADAQANRAINLQEGQVEEDSRPVQLGRGPIIILVPNQEPLPMVTHYNHSAGSFQ